MWGPDVRSWLSAIGGVVAVMVGGLWIAQGVGVAKGSFMTGHAQYTAYGVVLVVIGLGLLVLAVRLGRRGSP